MSGHDIQIKKLLSGINASFKEINHQPAASAEEYQNTLGTRFEQQVKVVLIRYKGPTGQGYAPVALPAKKQVDMEKVQNILGAKSVRLASKDELYEATECRFGELHPFASIYSKKLIFDSDLLKEEEVYFNAGKLDFSMVVNPNTIVFLERPIII